MVNSHYGRSKSWAQYHKEKAHSFYRNGISYDSCSQNAKEPARSRDLDTIEAWDDGKTLHYLTVDLNREIDDFAFKLSISFPGPFSTSYSGLHKPRRGGLCFSSYTWQKHIIHC